MINENDFLGSGIKYMFDAQLAEKIGLNNSIVFSNLVCQINDSNNPDRIYMDGKHWIIRSYRSWHEDVFPFYSDSTIKHIFLNLEKLGAIESCKPYKSRFNVTKAYTVNYSFADDIKKGGFKIWLN